MGFKYFMTKALLYRNEWVPVARSERRISICILNDKPIEYRYSQKGNKPCLLLPGSHLVSFIYRLEIKYPTTKKFDENPAEVRLFIMNAREIYQATQKGKHERTKSRTK